MTNSNAFSAKPLMIAYSDAYLAWKLGSGDGSHPTNPLRAKFATGRLLERVAGAVVVEPTSEQSRARVMAALAEAASPEHIHAVVNNYVSDEWYTPSPSNAATAVAMFGGTVRLVDELLAGNIQVGFNPQGAKHHARFDRSSGFCVFDDMAWAAKTLAAAGLKVAYLDWDIHAGDGVYHDLKGTGIPVLSIHNGGTFPGDPEMMSGAADAPYTKHNPAGHAYNWCLNYGDGDEAFKWAIDEAMTVLDGYAPDVLLIAAGADGHGGSGNLAVGNRYTYAGFEYAADAVAALARKHCAGRVLIGGAGGYQPLDHTPEIWARVVERIYRGASAPDSITNDFKN